jgi:hypothetical protein
MRCCLAVVVAAVAASLGLLVVFLVVAGISVLPMSPDSLLTALRISKSFFLWLPPAVFVLAFVLSYRASRNVPLYVRIFGRKMKAVVRALPQQALIIAEGGENGVWQTNRWRVTGGSEPTIAIFENGAWKTVFQARFEPGTPGQWVPRKITRDPFTTDQVDSRTVHSTNVGGRASRWEIVIYRPGRWEKELDDVVRDAKEAALARERDRFGLT